LVRETKTPIFILTSTFILGFFLSFYKFPFLILIFFVLGYFAFISLFYKNGRYLSLWLGFLLIFYLVGYFFFKNLKNFYLDQYKAEEIELLTTIEKVEPYYYGYLNTSFSFSIGEFIFKTDKKYFFPGQRCLITFQNKGSQEYFNPFSFEKEKLLLVKGIEAELKFLKEKGFVCEENRNFSLEKIRYKLFDFSEKLSGTAKGLIQALVLGVEYNFPEEYKEKLKNQGLYHQLAISGFNLAILFGIFYQIFYHLLKFTPLIRTGYPLQNISYLLALPAAFLILFLSGFCPSAFRAFIFLSLFIMSKLFFRNTSSLILLFLTAALILIFQPYLIGNLSFQLSFAATLGLIIGDRMFKTYFKNLIPTSNTLLKSVNYFFYLFLLSFIVSLFVFPFIIYINGTFPLATPINNLIATFFWSFIFIPSSIFIALLSFLNENIALNLANILANIFDYYIKIPFFEWTYRFKLPINLVILSIIFSLLIFIFLSHFIKNYKKYLLWCLISFIFYLLIYYLYEKIFYILIFDVGRASANLIKNKNSFILIDTGPNYFKDFNWTKVYLLPVLNKLGVEVIDLAIISHPDLDHSGGLETLKKHFYVKKVISGNFNSEDWEKTNILILPDSIENPEALKIKNTEVFFFPGKIPYEDLNRESLVVYLEYRGLTTLFPGDIDKIRFYRMKEKGEIFPVEILVSPHHGSKYSIDENIISWLNPKVVLTSGRGSNFPHQEYLKHLESFNKPQFSTEKVGAIFIFPKDDYFLICFEKEKRKNFLFSTLFPFIPLYLEDGFCKKFEYHKNL
jgi:competence protein ComEC